MIVRFSVWGARRPRAQKRAERAARRVLAAHAPGARGELNIVWCDRRSLRAMNRRFRGKRRFTDVIAFRHGETSATEPFVLPAGPSVPFGDLYISVEQAAINARRYRASLDEEIVRLVTHGCLHLLGYTDYEPEARGRMWAVQEPIVRAVMSTRRGPR